MRLLRELVLIELIDSDETWDGGIILKTEHAKTPPPQGKIIEVGPDVREVKVGQTVIYGKHAAQELEEGKVMVCESDIIAILGDV